MVPDNLWIVGADPPYEDHNVGAEVLRPNPTNRSFAVRGTLVLRYGIAGLAAVWAAGTAAHAAEILPHRANYTLELLTTRQGSGITGVRGVMSFEVVAACDGWTIGHRMRVNVEHRSGRSIQIDSDFTSWETRDGRSFRFESRSRHNGKLIEEISGRAEMADPGKPGTVTYTQPKEKQLELPPDTLFPVAHTLLVIAAAEDGKPLIWRNIFDGTTAEGGYGVNAVVGRRVALPDSELPAIAKRPVWPIKFAYFSAGKQAEVPEFEMSARMNDAGVTNDFVLDYGRFSLQASLKQIQALPVPDC